MKKINLMGLLIVVLGLAGCLNVNAVFGKNASDLYNGRLEAETVRLSAQTTGIVDVLNVDEGAEVKAGEEIAVINKEKLLVQKKQIQVDLDFNRDLLVKTKKMLASGAATQQRVDELGTKVSILESQKTGMELQLNDATIRSPINGVILNKYINRGELVGPGTLLVEVADLSELEAYIYLPLSELPKIKIGQEALVVCDGLSEKMVGRIVWVASESEFTPKTILTKETRTTLVYAVKIKVPNKDGQLKIGMPIDVLVKY